MASWISDGSAELQISGDVVTCTPVPASGGNTYNAMWKSGDGVNSGEHYWKINFPSLSENDSAFVGLTNDEKFGKGWSIRGLLYGGNLSNGSGLLIQNYGPRFKAGDTVGILASISDGKLKVYFDHNGSALGLGFDIDSSILPNVQPVVHFSGSGSATISKESAVPPAEARARISKAHVDIEGSWEIVQDSNLKISGKGFEGERFGDRLATLTLKPGSDGDIYKVSLHVINHVGFKIQRTGNTWTCVGGGVSTKMGGPRELMSLESILSAAIQKPESVTVTGNQLVLKSDDVEATFDRFDNAPGPYTENPFD